MRQVTCTVRTAGVPGDSWYQDKSRAAEFYLATSAISSISRSTSHKACRSKSCAFATPDPGHREESWAITLRFANGGLGMVHYVCGSQKGLDRETVDILGGGRSAQIIGFRRLILGGGLGGGMRHLQPDLGQKAMLQTMVASFPARPARWTTPRASSCRRRRCSQHSGPSRSAAS